MSDRSRRLVRVAESQLQSSIPSRPSQPFTYRFYRAAFGNTQPFPNPDQNPNYPGEYVKLPSYAVFVPDRAQVVGGANLAQGQLSLASAFVQRPEFLSRYPATLDGPGFVDAVLAAIKNDIKDQNGQPVDLTSQRDTLIGNYNLGGRGLVMYHLAADYWHNCDRLPGSPPTPCVPAGFGAAVDNRPFVDAEYNRAFVFGEYAGYLRRDSDIAGFLFWLNQVSRAPLRDTSKQHAMVCSFITSAEYQLRFSPVVTHTSAECPQ